MNLQDKIAIVTGALSGLGRATAELLASKGMRVVSFDKGLSQDAFIHHSVICDVADEQSVQSACDETLDKVGCAQVIVNCAGIAPAQRMLSKEAAMPLSSFKQVIDVNLIGTFNVMRVCAFALSKQEHHSDESRAVFINTASIAAFEGQIGQLAYSASKGGIVSMTLPAARELASLGIRVNTIAPGLMATPMLLSMPQHVQDNLSATVTFPKRFGKPAEFAALVAHIAENEFINGEVIRLDGALRMQAR